MFVIFNKTSLTSPLSQSLYLPFRNLFLLCLSVFIFCGFALFIPHARAAQPQTDPGDFFLYDQPDETVPAVLLENPLFYDAGIATASNGVWLAWLEFQPKFGDQIWLGLRDTDGKWIERRQINSVPGDFAHPTPTVDALGRLWLSYETAKGSDWNVVVEQAKTVGEVAGKMPVTFAGINHGITAAPDGSIIVICQRELDGRFQIAGKRIASSDKHFTSESLGNILVSGSAWHPSVAVASDNSIHAICDTYDGESYNVLLPAFTAKNKRPLPLAVTPAFEANAQIASTKDGKLWVSWEEDGENWGKHYLARTPGDKKSTRMSDKVGPLHRFRKLHLAQLDEKNEKLIVYEIPQPSFNLANNRTNAPDGLKNFGAFYEKSQLVVDGENRPWIVYRHFYVPLVGIVPETHKQNSARIYARCLLPDGWSKLYSFGAGQGDGMQRISISPKPDGINLAWTTGRTDRRNPKSNQGGVALAEISLKDSKARIPAKSKTISLNIKNGAITPAPRVRPSADIAGKRYELFFGDLHRHTDISLCFSPSDGTIDDAYRYGIDAAPLDFLGITDHTHDLAMGDPLSLIWWRTRKEVDRHALGKSFFPFYSYERSRADTDHNVISLRDEVLRPHTYPLTQFWDELDTNTFTIPHQPFNSILWNYKDNTHRPLLEIYQGFRHDAKEGAANEGLARGHEFGFIASSDHLSTSASFACVWSDDFSREGIFRAMQARRTYGATAKIILKVTCGEHWMGEKFSAKRMPPINIEVAGTDKIASAEVFVNGKSEKQFLGKYTKEKFTFAPKKWETGQHIFYVRVEQSDRNRAWSSPIWINIEP